MNRPSSPWVTLRGIVAISVAMAVLGPALAAALAFVILVILVTVKASRGAL